MQDDDLNAPGLESWVDAANEASCDFPLQNLPFGRFQLANDDPWRIGVAIGDQVLDLKEAGLIETSDMHSLMNAPSPARRALRSRLSSGLRRGSPQRKDFEKALRPVNDVVLGLPCPIAEYTDFYAGIHHATAVGRLFRPENPLLPNYKWVPVGYHGRASTVSPSGMPVRRPAGQVSPGPGEPPRVQVTGRLDFELEVGLFIGRGNGRGEPIAIEHAEEHLFGITLLNDWSARDIQSWEYQPLGPFLSKNFATTLSPWIVTTEALEPYRKPLVRPVGDPAPLDYLRDEKNLRQGAFDIQLEVWLRTAAMCERGLAGDCIARSNFASAAYWTAAQLITHHTVNGCALGTGDLLGSGTLSGESREEAGSLLERTSGGRDPLSLSTGEKRTFIEDGDEIVLRGYCEAAGRRRIGFGEARALVLPNS